MKRTCTVSKPVNSPLLTFDDLARGEIVYCESTPNRPRIKFSAGIVDLCTGEFIEVKEPFFRNKPLYLRYPKETIISLPVE